MSFCSNCLVAFLDAADPSLRQNLHDEIDAQVGADMTAFESEINGINDVINAKSAQLQEYLDQIDASGAVHDALVAEQVAQGINPGECGELDAMINHITAFSALIQSEFKKPFNVTLNGMQAASTGLQIAVATMNSLQAAATGYRC